MGGDVYVCLDTTAAAADTNPTPLAHPRVHRSLGPRASTACACVTPTLRSAPGRAWVLTPRRSATSRRADRMCTPTPFWGQRKLQQLLLHQQPRTKISI